MKPLGWLVCSYALRPLLSLAVIAAYYWAVDPSHLDVILVLHTASISANALADFGLRNWLARQSHEQRLGPREAATILVYSIGAGGAAAGVCLLYLLWSGLLPGFDPAAGILFSVLAAVQPTSDVLCQVLRGAGRYGWETLLLSTERIFSLAAFGGAVVVTGGLATWLVPSVLLSAALLRMAAAFVLCRRLGLFAGPDNRYRRVGDLIRGRWLAGVNLVLQSWQLRWPVLLLPLLGLSDSAAEFALILAVIQAALVLSTALATYRSLGGDERVSERSMVGAVLAVGGVVTVVIAGAARTSWATAFVDETHVRGALFPMAGAAPLVLASQYVRNRAAMLGEDRLVLAAHPVSALAILAAFMWAATSTDVATLYLTGEAAVLSLLLFLWQRRGR